MGLVPHSLELVPPDPHGCFVQDIIKGHLDGFLQEVREQSDGERTIPDFVVRELQAIVQCGDFTRGFIRLACNRCREPRIVTFSCKSRLCPSCAGRRMSEGAAWMVDRVLHPAMRWRQYVVSFPPDLARALCFRGKLASAVTGIVRRTLTEWQLSRAPSGGSQARPGGIIFIQRHTDSLDPWFHLHILSPDGVFRDVQGALDMSLEHQPPPTPREVSYLLETISRRVIRYLARSPQIPPDDPLLARCSEQRATPLRGHAEPPSTRAKRPTGLLAEHQRFTLHAGTSVAPHDSAGLERLVRYMSRPALSRERIDMTTSEDVVLNLKKTRRNGVRRFVLTPHAFLARLCAILPRPMSNQTLYYGVLAAASGARPYCIPAPPEPSAKRPVAPARPNTMAWAELLQRVFAKDIRQCPCGGQLQVIAVIESPNFQQAFVAAIILSNQPPTRMTGGP